MDIKLESTQTLEDPAKAYANSPNMQFEFRHIGKNGIIKKDTILEHGQPIALMCQNIKSVDQNTPHYIPYRYIYIEKARVVSISFIERDASYDNNKVIRIQLQIIKDMTCGDKMATNNGGKATIAKKVPATFLPVLANGVTPTVISNPSTNPSRMVCNQQLQQKSLFAYAFNLVVDSTGFTNVSPQTSIDMLNKLNPKKYDYVPLSSGLLGEKKTNNKLERKIPFKCNYKQDNNSFGIGDLFNRCHHFYFVGGNMNKKGANQIFSADNGAPVDRYVTVAPMVCIRICKFVTDMSIVMNSVPRLRIGEMECEVLVGTAVNTLIEKIMHHSDYKNRFVCRECGSFASVFNYEPKMKTIFGRCSNTKCYNNNQFERVMMRTDVIKCHQIFQQMGMQVLYPSKKGMEVYVL